MVVRRGPAVGAPDAVTRSGPLSRPVALDVPERRRRRRVGEGARHVRPDQRATLGGRARAEPRRLAPGRRGDQPRGARPRAPRVEQDAHRPVSFDDLTTLTAFAPERPLEREHRLEHAPGRDAGVPGPPRRGQRRHEVNSIGHGQRHGDDDPSRATRPSTTAPWPRRARRRSPRPRPPGERARRALRRVGARSTGRRPRSRRARPCLGGRDPPTVRTCCQRSSALIAPASAHVSSSIVERQTSPPSVVGARARSHASTERASQCAAPRAPTARRGRRGRRGATGAARAGPRRPARPGAGGGSSRAPAGEQLRARRRSRGPSGGRRAPTRPSGPTPGPVRPAPRAPGANLGAGAQLLSRERHERPQARRSVARTRVDDLHR